MSARRRVIFLFLDGVGLGPDDAAINPLAADVFPTLGSLLEGRRAVAHTGRLSTESAELIPTDASLGVRGRPQSATGQAALLTGINAPARLGEHYGPRPDARVRAVLDEGSIFRRLRDAGLNPYFCNAYPQRYFDAVARGKRLLSAVPYASTCAGLPLLTAADLEAGRALSADFTGDGWRTELGYPSAPVYSPDAAGTQLWEISLPYDFVFFEHWQTDVDGHEQAVERARSMLLRFDGFLGGLLSAADLEHTMVIVSSDHGNVEDCSHGKHTENKVLTLIAGDGRRQAAGAITALTDFVPAILDYLLVK